MTESIRALQVAADEALTAWQVERFRPASATPVETRARLSVLDEAWSAAWRAQLDATTELRQASYAFDRNNCVETYDRLIAAALACDATDHPPICGIGSNSGPHGEPLACGYLAGHDGPHAWASLPTWEAQPC